MNSVLKRPGSPRTRTQIFRLLAVSCILALNILTLSCKTSESMSKQTTLKISNTTASSNTLVEIGQIIFNSDGSTRLNLTTTDREQSSRLSAAWAAMQNSELNLPTETRGQDSRRYMSKKVRLSDPEFRWAVYSTLERDYGYSVEASSIP